MHSQLRHHCSTSPSWRKFTCVDKMTALICSFDSDYLRQLWRRHYETTAADDRKTRKKNRKWTKATLCQTYKSQDNPHHIWFRSEMSFKIYINYVRCKTSTVAIYRLTNRWMMKSQTTLISILRVGGLAMTCCLSSYGIYMSSNASISRQYDERISWHDF